MHRQMFTLSASLRITLLRGKTLIIASVSRDFSRRCSVGAFAIMPRLGHHIDGCRHVQYRDRVVPQR